jgi:putative heme-binding domain-containing protein
LSDVVDGETLVAIGRMRDRARAIAADYQAPLEDRLAAVGLIGRTGANREGLAALLAPRQPAELQVAAATALAGIPGDDSVTALITGWSGHSPALKSQILDFLLSRPGGSTSLLDAIERQSIPATQIDAPRRQRLLTDKFLANRDRSKKLFAATINPDRQRVIDAYQDVLKLTGDGTRGRAVFAKTCSVCHQLDKLGHAVGPDLAQLQNKSSAYLLQEILDPNRNVDARYVEYRATTKAGRVYNGVLQAESATSITLRASEGREQVLLRNEIDELESTGRSLMPEGLEKDLTRQDLADLFAYLSQRR